MDYSHTYSTVRGKNDHCGAGNRRNIAVQPFPHTVLKDRHVNVTLVPPEIATGVSDSK